MRYLFQCLLLFLTSCRSGVNGIEKESRRFDFDTPQRVTIQGYSGDIMEPFLSRDGRLLFFNNSNDRLVNTDLFYAEKINDTTFHYRGEVLGVNSPQLDAVATMDRDSNFYFVSTRNYGQDFSTICQGKFQQGMVSGITTTPGISRNRFGNVNFDVEISADGHTLYFVDAQFTDDWSPSTADLVMARKSASGFQRLTEDLLKNINTNQLEYAAALSADELTLYFTRVPDVTSGIMPRIWYATRDHKNEVFAKPWMISGISGFIEAATVAGDSLVYFHKKESDRFVLYVTRKLQR